VVAIQSRNADSVLCANEQPPGMMMSPMMRGMNAGGYYPGPYYDVSRTYLPYVDNCVTV